LVSRPALPRHNLPSQPTPFVGRADELARIAELLADPTCRLLTLTGPGGIGKSRLALQAAGDLAEVPSGEAQFSHGVYFVSLAAVSSTDSLVATVAEALNFTFYGEVRPRQQILDYLREKEMLLVLDNFEHLLAPSDGAAELMTDILAAAPGVKIMVTSRESLNLQEEWLYPVAGLPFPKPPPGPSLETEGVREAVETFSAVQLFEQCARRANPDFSPATAKECVVRICQLVEGMPLAIELAAAWLKMFSCEHIIRKLEQGLDFLTTSLRNVPDRHRSMWAVFEHSWQLLSEAEQEVFRQLSVFRGGFLQEAAEQVAGATFAELMALAEKSLLRLTPAGRYELHELLRQYAAEKLDQAPAISEAARDRHSAYYCVLLQQWEADLKGVRQQAAMAEIEAELENTRLAWHWAVAQRQIERLAGAMESLGMFYEWRGRYQEGEAAFRLVAEGLAGPESDGKYRFLARVLAWQGCFNHILGRTEHAGQLLQQSLSLLDGPELSGQDIRAEKAFVLRVMGGRGWTAVSSFEEERRLYEESLSLYRAIGDDWGTAIALFLLSEITCWGLNNYDEAKQLSAESLAIRQTLGDQRGIAESLSHLGQVVAEQGQLEEGERLTRESLTLFRELGDRPAIALRFFLLNIVLTKAGKFAETRRSLEEMLQIYDNLGDRGGVAQAHQALGYAEIMLGHYQQARTLIETARPVFQEFGWSLWLGFYFGDLGKVALAEQAYAEARQCLQESLAIFQEIGAPGSIAESLDGLTYAERGLGNTPEAQQYLSEALRIAIEVGDTFSLLETLPAAALLLADRGESERAVELYALASRYPLVANSCWFEDVAGRHIAAVAATLPAEVVTVAQERGRTRDLWETARELLVELE
jgi:predicted ATPase